MEVNGIAGLPQTSYGHFLPNLLFAVIGHCITADVDTHRKITE